MGDPRRIVKSLEAARLRRLADEVSNRGSYSSSRSIRERVFAATAALFEAAAIADRELVQ